MKTNIFKITVITLMLAGIISSCSERTKNEEPAGVIGKWQLIKATIPFTPNGQLSYDYSQYTIVYEFMTNNVLTVTGNTENIDVYIGHEIGEHFYSIVEDNKEYGMVGLLYGLKIDNCTSWFSISSEELIINGAPLDGQIYYFVKIK